MSLTKLLSTILYSFVFLSAANMAQIQPSIITSQGNIVADSASLRRTSVGLITVEYMRGNQLYRNGWYTIQFERFKSPKDDGTPQRILSLDNDGWLKVSAVNSLDSRYATNSAMTTALASKFDVPTGTNLQYIAGNGTLVTFPAIPAAQVNADWSALSGVAQILNKPTTLSGYGITDAYPLVGNPSGFLNAASANALYYPLSSNPAGYAKMNDTIGGAGNGTIMTTASATNSLNGKVGKTTTITINGNTQDLSANRTWNVGTVTNVSSANSNLTVTNGTTTPSLTVNSAPKLTTARNINGVAFDGTADITIPATSMTYNTATSTNGSAVTINAQRGKITLAGTGGLLNLLANGSLTVTLNNSLITATSTIVPNVNGAGSGITIGLNCIVQSQAAGTCTIQILNLSLLSVLNVNGRVIDFVVFN